MIKIIGTSHISRESVEQIKKSFQEHDFDLVAVELDKNRLSALKAQKVGVTTRNPIALIISAIQTYMSKKTGITPGTEMLTAVENAERFGIPVFLLDQDISLTLKGLKEVSLKEKIKITGYTLLGLFGRRTVKFDITKVPSQEFVEYMLINFKVMFPEFYNVLIEERNKYMVERIKKLEETYDDILVVVGAGHKPGMESLMES